MLYYTILYILEIHKKKQLNGDSDLDRTPEVGANERDDTYSRETKVWSLGLEGEKQKNLSPYNPIRCIFSWDLAEFRKSPKLSSPCCIHRRAGRSAIVVFWRCERCQWA